MNHVFSGEGIWSALHFCSSKESSSTFKIIMSAESSTLELKTNQACIVTKNNETLLLLSLSLWFYHFHTLFPQNLESRLKVLLPDDVGAALMDGVVLCHLANHIKPRSVASIHVPSPAVVSPCDPLLPQSLQEHSAALSLTLILHSIRQTKLLL